MNNINYENALKKSLESGKINIANKYMLDIKKLARMTVIVGAIVGTITFGFSGCKASNRTLESSDLPKNDTTFVQKQNESSNKISYTMSSKPNDVDKNLSPFQLYEFYGPEKTVEVLQYRGYQITSMDEYAKTEGFLNVEDWYNSLSNAFISNLSGNDLDQSAGKSRGK